MIYRPPVNAPAVSVSDPLTQALSQKQKVEGVMRKYGRDLPREMPKIPTPQWEGDNHA